MTTTKTEIRLYPYIINTDLVVDVVIDDEDAGLVQFPLQQVFREYVEDRTERDGFSPEYRQEVIELVAYLRHVASELELETDKLRKELH